jgi:hypothetical protein
MLCKRCRCEPHQLGCPYSDTRRPDRYSYYVSPRNGESDRVRQTALGKIHKLRRLAERTQFSGERDAALALIETLTAKLI